MEPSSITHLVHEIANVLIARNLTLSTAESCTGGGISFELTAEPGSSRWFEGGVISYSNQIKSQQLQVAEAVLNKYGAVSEQVAMEMASNVRKLLSTDISVAVTGIAGPDGGNSDKPVGTVWIAWNTGKEIQTRHFQFLGDREKIRKQAILEVLQGILFMIS